MVDGLFPVAGNHLFFKKTIDPHCFLEIFFNGFAFIGLEKKVRFHARIDFNKKNFDFATELGAELCEGPLFAPICIISEGKK